jgi:hypothetical protein
MDHSEVLDPVQYWMRAGLWVRLGLEPDEPRCLMRYLNVAKSLIDDLPSDAWAIAFRSARTLLRVSEDTALPLHWRQYCLNYLHWPIQWMARCARAPEHHDALRSMQWEMMWLDLRR